MLFDIIIQNPPYNPNSLWKKFVLKSIELLKADGKMIAIHPDGWRVSSTHNKLFKHLKEHISILHIKDYDVWKENKIAIKTDWYLYNKHKVDSTLIKYSNGEHEYLNLTNINKLLRFSTTSLLNSILTKITKDNYDNGIIIKNVGFGELYKSHTPLGTYKQCGGEGKGTTWTTGDYTLTNTPTEHQFENKVVLSYTSKPRATFFNKEEQIGIIRANYILTDNINSNPKSICLLYNSELFKIIYKNVIGFKPWLKQETPLMIPNWLLRSLNIDNLYANTIEELYQHFNLSTEEINFISTYN